MPKKVTQWAGWLKTQQAHMPRLLQNALSVAPAQAGAQSEAQLQLSDRQAPSKYEKSNIWFYRKFIIFRKM